MKFVLLGPPGSGKGTQAEKLHEKFDIPHISSGDILREEVARQTDFGKKIKTYMDRGEIGPVELITETVLSYIDKCCASGFILDGFPRTLYQAEMLDKNYNIVAVILLEVDEEEIIRRITGRRVCEKCKKIYHIQSSPPRKFDQCDKCGAPLIQRKDDTVETVKNRIRVYNEETFPLIEYYREKGILHRIRAEGDEEEIFSEILHIV